MITEQVKEEMIKEYTPFIWSMINKKFSSYPSKEDLFQAAYIGLDKALKNYKEERDTKFSSYLYFYILGEMKKLVREDRTLKVSRELSSLNIKIEKVKTLLTQKLGRVPTISEISEMLGIDEWLIAEALTSKIPVKSMEEPINLDGKEMCYHEVISDKRKDIDGLLDLKQALKNLSHEEYELINDLYFKERTQAEVAKTLHTSQVQVSRKKEKILQKMKQDLIYLQN